jgi:hypothetical protein
MLESKLVNFCERAREETNFISNPKPTKMVCDFIKAIRGIS